MGRNKISSRSLGENRFRAKVSGKTEIEQKSRGFTIVRCPHVVSRDARRKITECRTDQLRQAVNEFGRGAQILAKSGRHTGKGFERQRSKPAGVLVAGRYRASLVRSWRLDVFDKRHGEGMGKIPNHVLHFCRFSRLCFVSTSSTFDLIRQEKFTSIIPNKVSTFFCCWTFCESASARGRN